MTQKRDNRPEVPFATEYPGRWWKDFDEALRRWYDDYDANPEMSLDLIKDLYGPSPRTRSTPTKPTK